MPATLQRRAMRSGVRLRPLPELECLLAFSPTTRTLHWLNLNAWAIFELCDGSRTDAEVAAAYAEALEGKLSADEVSRQVAESLATLSTSGLIVSGGHEAGSE
ncbi:MAG TPA: PqqD family peptide modification chaperone [Kofleriaceae bacterium]|nr:PqqD family peptide modification chaperone [Kofleriaceae bacterium]